MVNSMLTLQDLLTGSFRSGNKKTDMDTVLPFVILPILLVVATVSHVVTGIVIVMIGMGALYVQSRPRSKNRSPFFLSWVLSSGIYLILIFEIEILTWLEITQLEHFVFLSLLTVTCYSFHKMKSVADFELATGTSKGKEYSPVLTADSKFCQICQIEVNDWFFHSIWWNCCILRPNYYYYFCGQIFASMTLLCGINFALTTVCQPVVLYSIIMIPNDCSHVYDDFHLAIGFASCVYALGFLIANMVVLLHNFFVYIPRYLKPQFISLVNTFNV